MLAEMYISVRSIPGDGGHSTPAGAPGSGSRRRWLSSTLIGLGLTSLFTDVSSEMVAAVLPLYLTVTLGFTPGMFGLVDGLQQVFTALVRPIGGLVADRRSRYKEFAASGYALSGLSKVGLAMLGGGVAPLLALLAIDRVGKGMRTAPRDALISLSVSPDRLATAFGFHRTLDTAGAVAGPLVAFALLEGTNQRLEPVMVWSILFAVIGLTMLGLFVKNPDRSSEKPTEASADRRSWRSSMRQVRSLPGFLRLTIAASLLGAATVSDGFLFLALQKQRNLEPRYFPLLFAGSALAYLALAVPIGRLADRAGRLAVYLAGYVALGLAYCVIVAGHLGGGGTLLVLGLLGTFYASTDGVLAAIVSALTPAHLRSTGLATLTTVVAVCRFGSSLLLGQLWDRWGVRGTFSVFVLGLLAAGATGRAVLRPLRVTSGELP